VALKRRRIQAAVIFLLFIIYFLIAARPIPYETVLVFRWISPLEIESQVSIDSTGASGRLFPFTLGSRFGYVDTSGQFAINRIKSGNIYLGENMYSEYPPQPLNIEIKNVLEETILNIENPKGYPVLLDNRVFLFGSEQNSLSEIGVGGSVLWTYEFGAPITCIDAAAGLLFTGSLDGVIEILDSNGNRVYYFEPGGSRYEVILGCAISHDGSYIGVISGIEPQRFMLFERTGSGEYRIFHHEFLETGFRRPVRIFFINEDRKIVFERAGGIGCFNIRYRRTVNIPLDGEIAAVENSGDQDLLFLVTSRVQGQNELIGLKLPEDRRFSFFSSSNTRNVIFIRASFKSNDIFLSRNGSMIVAGGGTALISFDLGEK
jgi:hypothetical protein